MSAHTSQHSASDDPLESCQELAELASPKLFEHNAFRITGLSVDSSTRDIRKRGEVLKKLELIGYGHAEHQSIFALDPPPSVEQIKAALERLQHPEKRLLDEMFWFWPIRQNGGKEDEALRALANSDTQGAFNIWASLDGDPAQRAVGKHNMAVLYNFTALTWENTDLAAAVDEERKQKMLGYWKEAHARWEVAIEDQALWDFLVERIRQIDDERLKTGFARRVQRALPHAFQKIHAELALAHYRSGRTASAVRHVTLMRDGVCRGVSPDKLVERLLRPDEAAINTACDQACERAKEADKQGAQIARALLRQMAINLGPVDALLHAESPLRQRLHDKVAGTVNYCQVQYGNATSDWKTCEELLTLTIPHASSEEMRGRLEKNLKTCQNNRRYRDTLEPFYERLKDIVESTGMSPSSQLAAIRQHIVPQLGGQIQILGGSDYQDAMNAVAGCLRRIGLRANNDFNDPSTALECIREAEKFVLDDKLKQMLTKDRLTLIGNLGTRGRQSVPFGGSSQSSSQGKGCGVAILVIVGVLGLGAIGNCSSNSSGNRSSSSPRVPTSVRQQATPSAPSVTLPPSLSSTPEHTTYRVPQSTARNLDFQKSALEVQRSALRQRSDALDRLDRQLEMEKILVDRYNGTAVDAFNRKVEQRNAQYSQYKEEMAAFNRAVDEYNERLRREGRPAY